MCPHRPALQRRQARRPKNSKRLPKVPTLTFYDFVSIENRLSRGNGLETRREEGNGKRRDHDADGTRGRDGDGTRDRGDGDAGAKGSDTRRRREGKQGGRGRRDGNGLDKTKRAQVEGDAKESERRRSCGDQRRCGTDSRRKHDPLHDSDQMKRRDNNYGTHTDEKSRKLNEGSALLP